MKTKKRKPAPAKEPDDFPRFVAIAAVAQAVTELIELIKTIVGK